MARAVGIHLGEDGRAISCDRVLLATGFGAARPGGRLVDELVAAASLPCAPCGYPVVDHGLRWHPRVHVTGPLAELELGPVARNIAGARRAGDRILAATAATAATANAEGAHADGAPAARQA